MEMVTNQAELNGKVIEAFVLDELLRLYLAEARISRLLDAAERGEHQVKPGVLLGAVAALERDAQALNSVLDSMYSQPQAVPFAA